MSCQTGLLFSILIGSSHFPNLATPYTQPSMAHHPGFVAHWRDQEKHLPAGVFSWPESTMTRVRKVLPRPQSFLHYQEALEEREVCMFLPPTCALLGGTSGRWDTCNSPSTLFLTFLYDCFQSVAIIFSDRLLQEKLPILYLPTGEAKNKYNVM